MPSEKDEELNKLREEAAKAEGGEKKKQADQLIELAVARADLFHTPDATCFASVEIGGHRETWPLRTKGFKQWLCRLFYKATGGAPNSEALQSALLVLEAKARFDGEERKVFLRVGSHHDKLYVDLTDQEWRAIEIDARGWRVVAQPPIHFRRSSGMKPLPVPEREGKIEALTPLVNVKNSDLALVVGFLMAAMRDIKPYPVLVLTGEQGSAKTTLAALLRMLLDPNTAPLRALPREERDLVIAANNAHVLSFDNVSGLTQWVSDAICRLSTGGGHAFRSLYTDQDEAIFDAQRPVILNGIEDVVEKPDLADRAIFVTLERIPKEKRKSEADLFRDFEVARPKILGALLDMVSRGIRNLPTTKIEGLPRMADFAIWATACEETKGAFMKAYTANIAAGVETVIEGNLVSSAIMSFMSERPRWEGNASALLDHLTNLSGERITKLPEWPKTPRKLSGQVRRMAPAMRGAGIFATFSRDNKARTITLDKEDKQPSQPSEPSHHNGTKPQKTANGDGSAESDGIHPTQSGGFRPHTTSA